MPPDLDKPHVASRSTIEFAGKQFPKVMGGFDRVLFTGPTPVLKRIVKPELLSGETEAGNVEYLGVVCVISLRPHFIC